MEKPAEGVQHRRGSHVVAALPDSVDVVPPPTKKVEVCEVKKEKVVYGDEDENWHSRSGWLSKMSPSALKGWQKQWFHLHDRVLFYFRDKVRPEGAVDLRWVRSIASVDKDFALTLDIGDRQFHLRAQNEADYRAWLEVLSHNHSLALVLDGGRKPDRNPAKKRWKYPLVVSLAPLRPRMKADVLFDTAGTGDLVLFRSKNIRGKMVRAATQSHYDHVGILLKFAGRKVGVLECLGNTGVQITNFAGFFEEKWHLQYHLLTLRKLICTLDAKCSVEFSSFVRTVVGRKYSWSPAKALKRNPRSFKDPKRTFFCSELVAEGYKVLGLLRDTLAASAYTPNAFSERFNLLLMKGARLGPETELIFEEDE